MSGPFIPIASLVLAGVQAAAQASQANAAADAQNKADAAQAAVRARQIETQHKAEERRRKDELKRATASTRARAGARGVGTSTSGSSRAVVQGLTRQSARQGEDTAKARTLQAENIFTDLREGNKLNLLRAEQARTNSFLNFGQRALGAAGDLKKKGHIG